MAQKLLFSLGLIVFYGASAPATAQPSPEVQANSPQICEVHVWQSKLYESSNGNAVGGLIGALVEGAVNASSPPKLVTEQMAQNLGDEQLAAAVKNLDWSRYIGARQVAVAVESSTVDEKTMRTMERSQTRSTSSTSECQIDLYVGKQTFQGGMKTWLFSKLGVRVFDAGKYRGDHAMEITHVKNFPAKSAEQYPTAIKEIRAGFTRNLTRLLDKSFGASSGQ
jgi:hypothetical protein